MGTFWCANLVTTRYQPAHTTPTPGDNCAFPIMLPIILLQRQPNLVASRFPQTGVSTMHTAPDPHWTAVIILETLADDGQFYMLATTTHIVDQHGRLRSDDYCLSELHAQG